MKRPEENNWLDKTLEEAIGSKRTSPGRRNINIPGKRANITQTPNEYRENNYEE